MKKLLLIVALVVMAGASSFAQLGVRAGVNFSKLSKDMSELTQSRAGFHAGIVYQADLFAGFSVQPGVYFSSKAYKADYAAPFSGILGSLGGLNILEYDGTANYIEMPILLKYQLDFIPDKFSVDTHVGPYFAYGISGKLKSTIVDEDVEIFKDPEDGGLDRNRFDAGLQFGLGINLAKKVYVGWDLDLGLKKIDNEGELFDKANLECKNMTHMITVGLWF